MAADEIWQDLLLHGMYLWVQFDPDRWSRPNETTSFSVIPVPKMHHDFSSMQRISMISVANPKMCVSCRQPTGNIFTEHQQYWWHAYTPMVCLLEFISHQILENPKWGIPKPRKISGSKSSFYPSYLSPNGTINFQIEAKVKTGGRMAVSIWRLSSSLFVKLIFKIYQFKTLCKDDLSYNTQIKQQIS